MECMEYFNVLLSKSQFGRSNESPWSHTLTLRGHEAFSNCFVEAARKIKTASPDSWSFQLPPPSTHLDNPVDNLFGFSFPSQSEIKF